MNKVDAIFCADLHLREDTPLCRTDDYYTAQWNKLSSIIELSNKHNCPVFIAGDIFNKSHISERLYIKTIRWFRELDRCVCMIPGNHDLENHNINRIDNSSISVLAAAIPNVILCPTELEKISSSVIGGREVGIVHKLLHGDTPIKAHGKSISSNAKTLLKKNPEYDVIISGDNHQTFVVEYEGRLLVNPGSMMRTTAAQTEHRPCVFLYNAESNAVEPHYFDIEKEAVTREYIDIKNKHNKRMDDFVTKLQSNIELGLDYEKNVERHIKAHKIRKSVQEIVWECLEV